MSIQNQLKKTIKILIVDDKPENIDAAKKYFSSTNIQADYANSAKEATAILKENKTQYDLIITDLEMETPTSGLDVIREGLRQYTLGAIATGQDATSKHHGANVTIKPDGGTINGKKNNPEIWEYIYEKSLNTILKEPHIQRSLNRHKKYVGKMDENQINIFLSIYK